MKKVNFWFLFRLLLVMNIVLITAIALAHPASITNQKAKDESCSSKKKINADVLNSITVKLM